MAVAGKTSASWCGRSLISSAPANPGSIDANEKAVRWCVGSMVFLDWPIEELEYFCFRSGMASAAVWEIFASVSRAAITTENMVLTFSSHSFCISYKTINAEPVRMIAFVIKSGYGSNKRMLRPRGFLLLGSSVRNAWMRALIILRQAQSRRS